LGPIDLIHHLLDQEQPPPTRGLLPGELGLDVRSGGLRDHLVDTEVADPNGYAAIVSHDLDTDVEHCNFCGNACTTEHGTPSCVAGACQVESCAAGWDDCDGNPDNGCETSLVTADNCNVCGLSCPASGGTPTCNAGVCDTRCDLTGTFALYLRMSGSWPRAGVIEAVSLTWLRRKPDHVRITIRLDENAQTRVDLRCVRPEGASARRRHPRLIHGFLGALDRKLEATPGQKLDPTATPGWQRGDGP